MSYYITASKPYAEIETLPSGHIFTPDPFDTTNQISTESTEATTSDAKRINLIGEFSGENHVSKK